MIEEHKIRYWLGVIIIVPLAIVIALYDIIKGDKPFTPKNKK